MIRIPHPILKGLLPLGFLTVFLMGWHLGRPPKPASVEPQAEEETEWTCSMHPQVRRTNPGICPLCPMQLIPLSTDDSIGLREIVVTPESAALMDLRVSPVVRRPAGVHVDLFGKIAYDERRVSTTTARMGGHLDRFYVDYTGTPVRKGDHIAEIYSPDLLVAQQDLIKATQGLARAREGGTTTAISTQERLLRSARERLRLLQITDDQIAAIAQQTEPTDHVTLFSPQDGIVIKRHVIEGAYVKEGDPLFAVAGLETVWLNLEAYETDLPWLKFAQEVTFQVEALPGKSFRGRVAYIDPELDATRRVVKVRVNVPNERRFLKPGMFVRASIDAQVTRDGSVIDPALAGKWISPMHPEIVRDGPGQCPICGMDLVRSEELGFIMTGSTIDESRGDPLLVPATAVLRTGRRATVYVRLSGAPSPKFEGREIALGPLVDEHFIVESGLAEGELVVTRGAFKLDSELQIKARPSMMNRNAGLEETPAMEAESALLGQWEPVPRALGRLLAAVRHDDADTAKQVITQLEEAIDGISPNAFGEETEQAWMEFSRRLRNALSLAETQSSENLQIAYRDLNHAFEEAGRYLGLPYQPQAAEQHISDEVLSQLKKALEAYFAFVNLLASDDEAGALRARDPLVQQLARLSMPATTSLQEAEDMASLRLALKPVSDGLISQISQSGTDLVGNAYVIHCPMAFDDTGADWLSPKPSVLNPYFGAEMLQCGSLKATLSIETSPESHQMEHP